MLKQYLALTTIFLQRRLAPLPTYFFKSSFFFADQKPRHPVFQTLLTNKENKDIYEILSEVQTLDKNDKIQAMRLIIKKAIAQQLPIDILQSDQFLTIASVYPTMIVISLSILCINRHQNIVHLENDKEVFECIAKAKVHLRRCYEELKKLPKQSVVFERVNLVKVQEKYIWTQYMIEEDSQKKEKLFQQSCECQRFVLNVFQKLITQKIQFLKNDKSLTDQVINHHLKILIGHIWDYQERSQTLEQKIQFHGRQVEDQKLLVYGLEEYISNLELVVNSLKEFDFKQFYALSLKFQKQVVKNKWFYQALTDQVSEKEASEGCFEELQNLFNICERELKSIGEPKYEKEINILAQTLLEMKQEMEYCVRELKGQQMSREEFVEIRKRNIDDILSMISSQEMKKKVEYFFVKIIKQEEENYANQNI